MDEKFLTFASLGTCYFLVGRPGSVENAGRAIFENIENKGPNFHG